MNTFLGDRVAIGAVARPHGIRGELRVQLFNEESGLLVAGRGVVLRLADGSAREARVTHVRPSSKSLLVRFDEVADRNAAEGLRGATILVARSEFPPLAEGEFYACDIEGARVVLLSGQQVGHVSGIQSYPTCDVLVVEREDQGPLEVPLVEAYVESVRVEERLVMLRSVDGLE